MRLKKMVNWIIINEGLPDPTFRPGGISNTIRTVKCPKCKNIFNQKVSSGCFHTSTDPLTCPKCHYPWDKEFEERKKERRQKEIRDILDIFPNKN